jgi:hypothetical protein
MQGKIGQNPPGHRLVVDWKRSKPYSFYAHKYGGTPSNGASLPECPSCHAHLHLVFQIDLADPSLTYLKLDNLDYLYVLTCLNCASYERPLHYQVKKGAQDIRVLLQRPGMCVREYPDPLDEYPVSYRDLEDDEYPVTEEIRNGLLAQEGKHQLGGMPVWIQREEHTRCITCGRVMEYIAMADSELYIGEDGFRQKGHMFGDEGILYVFLCRQCGVLATKAQSF